MQKYNYIDMSKQKKACFRASFNIKVIILDQDFKKENISYGHKTILPSPKVREE